MKMDSVAMLNAIRSTASEEYQERIPEATRTNLQTVGKAITEYAPTLNEFTGALVSKIALQLFVSKMAKNRLAPFKKGMLKCAQYCLNFLHESPNLNSTPEGSKRKSPAFTVRGIPLNTAS